MRLTITRQRLTALFAALMLCVGAQGQDITDSNGFSYMVNTDDNTAMLADVGTNTQSEIVIPDNVTAEDGNTYRVTSLMAKCFWKCSDLTSVTIPSSVKNLGEWCFGHCTNLASVTIPESVTSLGAGCFYNTGLTSITIPSSVTSIGKECFKGCSGVKSITIPSSVTSLSEGCFSGCTSLASVTIPESVTTLGASCFSGCASLTSVTIPSSVTSLGNKCFFKCSGLTSIVLPTSVTGLGDDCFQDCTNLATVYASLQGVYVSNFKGKIPTDKLRTYIQFGSSAKPNKYATLCLKNRVYLKSGTCENMGAVYTVSEIKDGDAVLAKVTDGKLEPGVAYIVENQNPEGLTIPNGAVFTLSDEEGQLVENALLQGTFEDIYAPAGSYVLQSDGKFHVVAEGYPIKVGAYRAYLNVTNGTHVQALSMQFGGETTGIDGITETKKEANPYLYDLTGRRVTSPQKGQVYIRSGKKVLY